MTLASIPLAGVIGDPIAHSKSPILHGHWLKTMGLPGHYVPLEVKADDLGNVLKAMPKMGFVGCNVTIPHNEHVMQYVDQITDRATLIGAVNTLTSAMTAAFWATTRMAMALSKTCDKVPGIGTPRPDLRSCWAQAEQPARWCLPCWMLACLKFC